MTSALRRKGLPNSSMTTRVTNTIKPSPRYLQGTASGQGADALHLLQCQSLECAGTHAEYCMLPVTMLQSRL